MVIENQFEQLIREHVAFSRKAATGFEQLKCQVCNDYKIRAGFKFENGKIRYHCFNCSLDRSHFENARTMSPEFRDILHAFHIDDNQIDSILSKKFFTSPVLIKKGEAKKPEFILPKEVDLPPQCHLLAEEPYPIWKEVASAFLLSRGLTESSYSWYLSNDRKYRSKLIIPYFRQGEIIYWQAREMDSNNSERYLNPAISRNNILFNFDELNRYTKDPLFITEGVFDSISIGQNAVGLAGSTLSPFKVEMLKRVRGREIIFVIDKDKNGKALGESAVKEGWTISFIEGELEDTNDALQKMGKIWMLNNLLQNRKTNFDALLWLQSIKIKEPIKA